MFYNANGLQAGLQNVLCGAARSLYTVTLRRKEGRTISGEISQGSDAGDLIQETGGNSI